MFNPLFLLCFLKMILKLFFLITIFFVPSVEQSSIKTTLIFLLSLYNEHDDRTTEREAL